MEEIDIKRKYVEAILERIGWNKILRKDELRLFSLTVEELKEESIRYEVRVNDA